MKSPMLNLMVSWFVMNPVCPPSRQRVIAHRHHGAGKRAVVCLVRNDFCLLLIFLYLSGMVWNKSEVSDLEKTMLYVCVCAGAGGIMRCLLKSVVFFKMKLPYGAALLILGMMLGGLSVFSEAVKETAGFIVSLTPSDMLAILYPAFVLKTAFQLDFHVLVKSCLQITVIAILGFMIVVIMTGFFMTHVAQDNWSLLSAMIFGIIINTTETKQSSKSLRQFKHLGVLLLSEEVVTSLESLLVYEFISHALDGDLNVQPSALLFFRIIAPFAVGFTIGKIFIFFLSWDLCDFSTHISLSLCFSYMMYYVLEEFIGASGILGLTVFGIIICCNRQFITSELEQSLVEFWELVYSLFNYVLYIETGLILVQSFQEFGEGSDIIGIVITYIVCFVSRFLMFLILSPILCRLGYGLSWRSGAFLVWGGLRGTTSLLLSMFVYQEKKTIGRMAEKILIYMAGLVLLNLIINGSTLQVVFKALGLDVISIAKLSNMNNAFRYVLAARERAINMLKMNRLFADANWIAVRNATKIVHPYKVAFNEKEGDLGDDDNIMNYRYSRCPECHLEILNEPSTKERDEMMREAQVRVLKAKKVSYWRQYEQGLMSREGNRLLVSAVEDALNKEVKIMDIAALRNTWTPQGCTVNLRNKLVKIMPKDRSPILGKPPQKRCRLFCYRIISSIWWEYGIFLLITLNMISIILDLNVTFVNKGRLSEIILLSLSAVCFAVLLAQIAIKVAALGFYSYLRSVWDLLDILTVTITFFYLLYTIKYLQGNKGARLDVLVGLSAARSVQLVRFFRLFVVIRATIPKIVAYLDKKIDVKLAFGYDVGKGFVTGEDEVLKLLPRIVDEKTVFRELKEKMEAERLLITKEIGILQRSRPTIAITVKTRESMVTVLHIMAEAVEELKNGGLLDDEEYGKLCDVIFDQQKVIRKHYMSIPPNPPEILLKQIIWLVDDEETADFLIINSLMVNLNYEEILVKADDSPQGIYVIISGLVKTTYFPNLNKLREIEQKGALPNIDYPTSIAFREKQVDYIVSGNVIGEIGVLTNRTYDSTISCESSVQAYFISIEVMKEAMRTSSNLHSGTELKMWKAVSVRLASIMLLSVPAYQSWSQEQIQLFLEQSFVPNLGLAKAFIIDDLMEAVLLIEGIAFDASNNDLYFGPTYIPRSVQKLVFPKELSSESIEIQPRLLIIPAKDVDEEEVIEMINMASEEVERSHTCMQHQPSIVWSKSSLGKGHKKRAKRNVFGFKKVETVRGKKLSTAPSSTTSAYSTGKIITDYDTKNDNTSNASLQETEIREANHVQTQTCEMISKEEFASSLQRSIRILDIQTNEKEMEVHAHESIGNRVSMKFKAIEGEIRRTERQSLNGRYKLSYLDYESSWHKIESNTKDETSPGSSMHQSRESVLPSRKIQDSEKADEN